MEEVAFSSVMVLAAMILIAALVYRRSRVRLTKLTLPFAEFEVGTFADLTAVTLFNAVSKVVLPAHQLPALTAVEPLRYMHAGWMMVCDAFVTRYAAYPSADAVNAQIAALGAQTAEMVNVYRDLYQRAIAEGDRLPPAFALDYVTRGPALAQRIARDGRNLASMADDLYARWLTA